MGKANSSLKKATGDTKLQRVCYILDNGMFSAAILERSAAYEMASLFQEGKLPAVIKGRWMDNDKTPVVDKYIKTSSIISVEVTPYQPLPIQK